MFGNAFCVNVHKYNIENIGPKGYNYINALNVNILLFCVYSRVVPYMAHTINNIIINIFSYFIYCVYYFEP